MVLCAGENKSETLKKTLMTKTWKKKKKTILEKNI
jgi:hypothetical protein